ncbi:MAG TPA: hypothetical protein DDY14_06355 [Chromatiaceae bacterium]|nr:MAG: hypothetical protein N838_12875 [Thiohalocapsa sp. PB-PSB1]HBG94940.1 hypothetical protein [Chromatiaceae bacterium]HCS92841.1 hypothetical protein [Chromatiaceae bacterium]
MNRRQHPAIPAWAVDILLQIDYRVPRHHFYIRLLPTMSNQKLIRQSPNTVYVNSSTPIYSAT